MTEHFASGNWRVREGSEDEFVSRWREWIGSSAETVPGFKSARLLRDVRKPGHFVSLSDWDDPDSRRTWKESAEFAEGMAWVRELCDDFSGGDYTEVVEVSATSALR